jgi:hypothetical protein
VDLSKCRDVSGSCQSVNLTQDLFIGEVLQGNCPGAALRIADTVSLAENRVNMCLSSGRCIDKLYCAVCTRRDAGSTGDTFTLIDLTYRT